MKEMDRTAIIKDMVKTFWRESRPPVSDISPEGFPRVTFDNRGGVMLEVCRQVYKDLYAMTYGEIKTAIKAFYDIDLARYKDGYALAFCSPEWWNEAVNRIKK